MKNTFGTVTVALAAMGLLSVANVRASMVPVGDPYATHSWAQNFNDTEAPFNSLEFVNVSGDQFENPGITALSDGWTSTYASPTLVAASGPTLTYLSSLTVNFLGTQGDTVFDWYAFDGSTCVGAYEMFYGDVLTGTTDIGGGWTYNLLPTNVTPLPVPEASTMIAGALLLLPFGVSTFRILRRYRVSSIC